MALEARIAKLEAAAGGGSALVSVVIDTPGKTQDDIDRELEREDARVAEARESTAAVAGIQIAVVRIGVRNRLRGWRERLAARRAGGRP